MSMTLNERNPNTDLIQIGSQATGATVVYPGLYARKHMRIKNVYYMDGAAIAKDSTNHVTIKVQDNSSTPVVYASGDTSAAAVVAVTQYPLALTRPEGPDFVKPPISEEDVASEEEDVPASTMLNVSVQTQGTAVSTNAKVMIEWYPA